MPELNETYVVHCAICNCSMGIRDSYAVLENTHGVYLRGQPQMTVADCKDTNLVNFGGCYSVENPSTQAAADEIRKQVEEECPDTFLDTFLNKVTNCFTEGKKETVQADPSQIAEGQLAVLGECHPCIMSGQDWSEGKDGVETDGARPVLGGAKLYCKYGGQIEIVGAGQPEA